MRKLVNAAMAYTAALVIAHYVLPHGWLLICAAVPAALSLPALALRGNLRVRAMILLLSSAVGFLWYWGYGAAFAAPAEELAGQTRYVTARVTDYGADKGNYSVVYVRLEEANLPRAKVAVYDFYGHMPQLSPGDMIRAELSFSTASESYGEVTDVYSSRGIFVRASLESKPENLGRAAFSFLYFPKVIAEWVREATGAVFSGETRAYMEALLIGSNGGLYQDRPLYNAITGSGILHTVAVSGMHLAYLWGFLSLILTNKRMVMTLGIPAVWVFAVMAGFTPSVARAAFTLTMAAVAPLLRRENDAPTALSAILLILLLENPFAVGSISLQLSFSAMAGILLLSGRINSWLNSVWKRPENKPAVIRRFIIASLSSTLGAIILTTPVGALHFGAVSLVSPLTNLLVLWVIPFSFIGGYAAVFLGAVLPPLGMAAAWLVSISVKYIIFVAKLLSSLPFAVIYTANSLTGWWLIFSYAVFLYAWWRKGKARFRPLVPISVSVTALAVLLAATAVYYNSGAFVTAIDVGQGQCLAVFQGCNTVLIDCGGGGKWRNAGDTAADYLIARGRTRVDMLVLTHLHADHANGVSALMSRMDVRYLALPADAEDEDGLVGEIISAALRSGTEIMYVSEDTDAAVGGISLRLYEPLGAGDLNERGIIVIASVGDYDMLVTGDVNVAVERLLVDSAALPDFELLVAGHHGSKYATSYELLDAVRAETAIISVGYNNYGHPTREALWRLSAYGMTVFRTDQMGTVTLRIDKNG